MRIPKNIFKTKPTEFTWAILAITRFFLALIVLIHHMDYYFNLTEGSIIFEFIASFGGKAAVLGFLLISGISIGHSYFVKKEGFIKRRFLRIYPLYFIAVIMAVCLQYYLGSPYELPNITMVAAGMFTSIGNLLLLQGIAVIPITYNGPLWSLGVEFFLYLMVPFLFMLRLRYILLVLLVSLFAFFNTGFEAIYGYINLQWAWPFIIGIIISAKKQSWVAVPFLIAMPIVVFFDKNSFITSLSWLNVSFTVIISFISLNFEFKLSNIIRRVFNYLGTISYPIYVFHLPILMLLYHLGVKEAYTLAALVVLITIPLNYIFDDWLKKIFWKPMVHILTVKWGSLKTNYQLRKAQ